jgi:DNA-binding XRE family transcriptional regulator
MNKKSKLNQDFDKQFGAYVKKMRQKKGWKQEDLASAINADFQNVSRLETGNVTPSLFWCNQLAKAFDMTISEFLAGFEFKRKK